MSRIVYETIRICFYTWNKFCHLLYFIYTAATLLLLIDSIFQLFNDQLSWMQHSKLTTFISNNVYVM